MQWQLFILLGVILGIGSGTAQQVESELVGSMPDELFETSGLLFLDDKLISHNDSGNDAILYEMDINSLEILRTVTITNASNVDWEDIAQDETHIYIGDFGNNNGSRRDLAIYKVAKNDFRQQTEVEAELILFAFEDQTNFDESTNTDWDAEALIVLEDSLVIFTKQWVSKNSSSYTIPKIAGEHLAVKKNDYPINGLVTGATYDTAHNCAILVGYSSTLIPFIFTIQDPLSISLKEEDYKKEFLSLSLGQAEGIAIRENGQLYISTERFQNNNPPISLLSQLFVLSLSKQEEEEEPILEMPGDSLDISENSLWIYPSNNPKVIAYKLETNSVVFGRAIYDVLGRKIRYNSTNSFEGNEINLTELESAVYYLTFYLQNATISKPFILR